MDRIEDQTNAVPGSHESFVVIDADRERTRALLFDLVEGQERFVAVGSSRATATPATDDISAGIAAALSDLESLTGRSFVADGHVISPQQYNGDGADAYYVTGVPLSPMRAAVIPVGNGPLAPILIGGARRTQTTVVDAQSDLAVTGGEFSVVGLGNWLRSVQPHVVMLIHDGGSAEAWRMAVEAVASSADDLPLRQGIIVGGEAHQRAVAEALGEVVDLSGIDPSAYDVDEVALAIESELRAQYNQRVDDARSLRLLGSGTFVDRVEASHAVAAFLNRRMGRNVLATTIGDGALLHAVLGAQGGTIFRADVDLGNGARSLLRMDSERIARWLPFRWSVDEIAQWLLNRSLRPGTEPNSPADVLAAAAVWREMLTELVRESGLTESPNVDLIAIGASSTQQDPALTVLSVLDGILPNPADGLVTVALDTEGLMDGIGAIALDDPAYAAGIVERDFLTPLATCVVVTGQGAEGALAVRGEIRDARGESRQFSVPIGSIHRLPLEPGNSATLTLEPEPDCRIGRGSAGEPVKLAGERQVQGTMLGVVIDARGRPLSMPNDPSARISRLQTWMNDLGVNLE